MGDPDAILERVRQLLGANFEQVAGTVITGEIPIGTVVVNRVIEERLATSSTALTALRIEAHDQDELTAFVTLRTALVPMLKVLLRIEQQPNFPEDAAIGLRWSVPALGPLAALASPALSLFKKLPPGVHIRGDRLTIDLYEQMLSSGYGELIQYLNRLQIHTRAGRLVIQFELRVNPMT